MRGETPAMSRFSLVPYDLCRFYARQDPCYGLKLPRPLRLLLRCTERLTAVEMYLTLQSGLAFARIATWRQCLMVDHDSLDVNRGRVVV